MRLRLWFPAIALALAAPASVPLGKAFWFDRAVPFRIEPVALYPGNPQRRQLGALRIVRGYRLVSRDPAFGGFSAMWSDGTRFVLLSDNGDGIRFRLDATGQLTQPGFFTLPGLPQLRGDGEDRARRDTESLTVDPPTGRAWVGFEHGNMIARYAPGLARQEAASAPAPMRDWPDNSGPEALCRLRDGRFLVFDETEYSPRRRERGAVMFLGDPALPGTRWWRFYYVAPPGYVPTDVAQLPDGRLILVNRRVALFEGFTARLTLLDPRGLRPGAVVRGREIAAFTGTVQRDNFEAVAVVRAADGTHLWLASDDNQSPLEASLLLDFILDEAALRPPPKPRRGRASS